MTIILTHRIHGSVIFAFIDSACPLMQPSGVDHSLDQDCRVLKRKRKKKDGEEGRVALASDYA